MIITEKFTMFDQKKKKRFTQAFITELNGVWTVVPQKAEQLPSTLKALNKHEYMIAPIKTEKHFKVWDFFSFLFCKRKLKFVLKLIKYFHGAAI